MLFGVPDDEGRDRLRRDRPRRHPQRRDPRRGRRGRRRHRRHGRPVPRRVHRPRPLRRARPPTARSTTTRPWSATPRWRSRRPRPGAHVVGPSGMMDGQVGVVRAALDADRRTDDAPILAYAAKYASAFYGPFREAVESTLQGDRRTYQQDPANARRGAARARARPRRGRRHRDGEAGAALPRRAAPGRRRGRRLDVPVAAYQVSGEYAMVEAAAATAGSTASAAILETLTVDPAGRRRHHPHLLGGRGRRRCCDGPAR